MLHERRKNIWGYNFYSSLNANDEFRKEHTMFKFKKEKKMSMIEELERNMKELDRLSKELDDLNQLMLNKLEATSDEVNKIMGRMAV